MMLTAAALITSCVLLNACKAVSDEAYYSALKATSEVPEEVEQSRSISLKEKEDLLKTPAETSGAVSDTTSGDLETGLINTEEINVTTPVVTQASIKAVDLQPQNFDSKIIEAPYGLCYDLTNQVLLYGKDIDTKIYPASITKLLTALVAIDNTPEDFICEIGDEIWMIESGSSVAQLKIGQKLGLEAILTALLVPSGNDAAYSVAVNVARYKTGESTKGNGEMVDYFSAMMNEYTKQLGLQDSHFTNPDGYHNSNHFSTLRDLLKISIASVEHPLIASICKQLNPVVYYASGESATWTNHIPFLGSEEWGIEGLKTGFTDESLYSFTAYAEIDGNKYITIVSGCQTSEQRNADTKKLLTLAGNGFEEGAVIAYDN